MPVGTSAVHEMGIPARDRAEIHNRCSVAYPRWLRGKESARDAGDAASVPGWGRSPQEEMATYSSVLTWEIPRTEELGGL